MDDLQLQQLLQLKRCEIPFSHSSENFITEFHRRQRVALLQPSFLQQIQERLSHFFAEFQVPRMAYVTATAIALFLSLVILRDPHFSHAATYASQNSSLEQATSLLNPLSSPAAIDRIQPVSLDIKNDDINDNTSVVSPLSYIIQRKKLQPHPLLSF